MKACGKCKLDKELTEFHKSNRYSQGVSWQCKLCQSIESKRRNNNDAQRAKAAAQMRKWRSTNRERSNATARASRKRNREKILREQRAYYRDHADEVKMYYQIRRLAFPERARASDKKSNHNRKDKTNARYREDPQFNLRIKISRRIKAALRVCRQMGNKKTIDLLGCSFEEFQAHIESRFAEDMTWDKVLDGSIHLDHIMPVSSFDLTDVEQQKIAFHYTNVQPLWARDNIVKSNHIIEQEEPTCLAI